MSLKFFRDLPLNSGSQLDAIDLFTGDGVTTTFPFSNKTSSQVGGTIQAGATQYFRFNGGFVVSGSQVTLSSAPPPMAEGIIPGVSGLVLSAYDQSVVTGVTNPRIDEDSFILADVDDIGYFQYDPKPGDTGIQLLFVDNASAVGATLAWVQLACSDPSTGLAMTYSATGASLYTPSINMLGTIWASSEASASSIYVDTASGFIQGDYIIINIGNATSEVRKITSVNGAGQILAITGNTNFPHYVDETVYTIGRKFWAKLTVPVDANNGEAINLYDISLRRSCKKTQRT